MAATTANMALKQWNAGGDFFSYSDLSANWGKVDLHDHTSGKGVQIPAGGLGTGSVITSKIAANAVDVTKIADNAVETAKIKDLNITNAKIAASAVTAAKLGTDAKIITGSADQTGANPQTIAVGSWVDITGVTATFTPTVPSILVCFAIATFGISSGANFDIRINLDGAQSGVGADAYGASSALYSTITAFTIAPVTAAAHTVKLQGYSLASGANIYKSVTASSTTGIRFFYFPA